MDTTTDIPMPPDADADETLRWEESRLRRRMLTGRWENDIALAVKLAMGDTRAQKMGRADMSSNVFAHVCGELATLYDRQPEVEHDDPEAQRVMRALLTRAGWTARMRSLQRFTLGLREMVVRVDAYPVDGTTRADSLQERVRLALRFIYPDTVVGTPGDRSPDQFIALTESRYIDGKWWWESFDLQAATAKRVPCRGAGDAPHPALEWVWREDGSADGRPFLPHVVYHADVQDILWDPWAWRELVVGTLQCGVHWTYFSHALRQASWPQRYTVGLRAIGRAADETGEQVVVADPAVVLEFERVVDEDTQQPLIGQWAAGADPDKIISAVSQYEERLMSFAGVPASDIVRTSADPRSGVALALSADAKIRAAARYEETFRRSDLRLLRTIASTVNASLRTVALPTTGWRITYPSTQTSTDPRAPGAPARDGTAPSTTAGA